MQSIQTVVAIGTGGGGDYGFGDAKEIRITGGEIFAESNTNAAIGSGAKNFIQTINIIGKDNDPSSPNNPIVVAKSTGTNYSVGIGSISSGVKEINIKNATITSEGEVGIGAASSTIFGIGFSGIINIDNSVVKATGLNGTGIGIGFNVSNPVMGDITITNSDVVATGASNSSAIGSGYDKYSMSLNNGLDIINESVSYNP